MLLNIRHLWPLTRVSNMCSSNACKYSIKLLKSLPSHNCIPNAAKLWEVWGLNQKDFVAVINSVL